MKKFLIFLFIIIFIGGVFMSTYGFKSNKCKDDLGKKETTIFNELKARGILQNGEIDMSSYSNARVSFTKRNGMVLAAFLINSVQTYKEIVLFNSDDSPFEIPDNFKPLGNWTSHIINNFDINNSETLIKGEVCNGEIILDENVIFDGTYISFNDFSSTSVSRNLYFVESLYYMAENM